MRIKYTWGGDWRRRIENSKLKTIFLRGFAADEGQRNGYHPRVLVVKPGFYFIWRILHHVCMQGE